MNAPADRPAPPPLKPRRGLFVGLLIAWTIWIAFLLVLNATT